MQTETEALFAEAEALNRCCVADSHKLVSRLSRLAKSGAVVRTGPALYARAKYWDSLNPLERHLHIVRALAVKHPQWVFCDVTAAALWGLAPSYALLSHVHVVAPESSHYASKGAFPDGMAAKPPPVCWHHARVDEAVEREGVRVTSLRHTLVDCLRRIDFSRALALADAGIRQLGWTSSQLVDYIKSQSPSYVRAEDTAAVTCATFADPRSESGGESIARGNMICLGREIPHLQVWIDNPVEEGVRYRADFVWMLASKETIVGELDGKAKYRDDSMTRGRDALDVLFDERQRESRLSAAGVRVMRFGFADVRDPMRFSRILDAYDIPLAVDVFAQAREREELRLRCGGSLALRFGDDGPRLVPAPVAGHQQ